MLSFVVLTLALAAELVVPAARGLATMLMVGAGEFALEPFLSKEW